MREPFPLSGWLIIGLLIAVAVFLLAGPRSQAASDSFTLTEIDPTGENHKGRWQYKAQTSSPQDTITSWRDSPWYWRHWNSDKCDNTKDLFPADPDSVDTTISADGQTVTVDIYQAQDSTWVCFALECDDGSYSFALMRNTQTERTITSGACSENSNNRINQPDRPAIDSTESDNDKLDPVDSVDPINNPNGQGEEGPGGNDQDDQNGQGQGNGQDDQNQDDGQGNDQNDQGQNQDDDNQPNGENQTNQPPTTESPPIDKTPSK